MRRNIVALLVIFAVAFVGSMFIAKDASAIPAFARQTGHACTTCHFNSFPSLNSFGRAFEAGGFTDIGTQGKIEDEGLSIPNTLNAALITKIRYQQAGGKGTVSGTDYSKEGTGKGELQFPDEAALFLGGRVSENIGFIMEGALQGGDTFTSFKMPIGLYGADGTHVELIPFTTDALGAAYGFELLNTGAVRHLRPWEARKVMSAHQYIGTATAAEGFALAVSSEMFFVNLSLWGPAHGTVDTGLNLSQYARVAITPNVGGWDLGIGVQYWGGETKVGNTDATPTAVYKTSATAVDAQAQGDLGGMPLGVYLSWANAPKKGSSETATNLFNSSSAEDLSATAIAFELGVVPSKFNLGAGYRLGNKNQAANRTDNALLLGGKYFLAQNVQVHLNYEMYSGDYYTANSDAKKKEKGDSLLTLMLFSGF